MYVKQSRVGYKFSIKGILNEFLLRVDVPFIQGSTTIQALKMFHEKNTLVKSSIDKTIRIYVYDCKI